MSEVVTTVLAELTALVMKDPFLACVAQGPVSLIAPGNIEAPCDGLHLGKLIRRWSVLLRWSNADEKWWSLCQSQFWCIA